MHYYKFVGSVFVLLWIIEMMQNCLRLVFTKCPFVRNEISEASEQVKTNFAFVDEITLIQKHFTDLKKTKKGYKITT